MYELLLSLLVLTFTKGTSGLNSLPLPSVSFRCFSHRLDLLTLDYCQLVAEMCISR